jgi:hypothetical protein
LQGGKCGALSLAGHRKFVEPPDAFVGFLQGYRELCNELRAALRATGGVVVRRDRRARVVQLQRNPPRKRVRRKAAAEVDDIDREFVGSSPHLVWCHAPWRCTRNAARNGVDPIR